MILIDTREKKIDHVLMAFRREGIQYARQTLCYGDYMDSDRHGIVVERKQSILELAGNCTRGHDRFRRELERAKDGGSHMVILVEQNRYKDRGEWVHVHDITDLMLWSNPHTTIRGEKVYRVLASWCSRYDVEVQFCDRRSSGRRIMEILYASDTQAI